MPTDKPLPESDDDIIDLTDLVEEGSVGDDAGNDAPVDMSFEQELEDLFGDAEPTPATSAPATDDAMADLFGDDDAKAEGDDLLAQFDAAPKPAAHTPEASGTDEAPAAPEEADDALDLSDMSLSAFEPEAPQSQAADEGPGREPSMDDLLGDLPPAPDEAPATTGGPDLAELDAIEETPAVAPLAAATAGAIDLAALDKLIDTAKGPAPESPDEEAAKTGRLDALGARIDALETSTATLCDKVEALPTAADGDALADALAARIDALETSTATLCDKVEALPTAADGDALADALSARLEDSLSERLDAILAGQPQAPDHEKLKAEILEAADEKGGAARDALLAEVRQSLARLETLTQDQQGQFTDFTATMETRLAEITRELPQPDAFATKDSLAASLETLGETLSRDIAGKLDERLTELRRELRETLSTELASTLDERLAEAMESAKQTARQEVEALGGVLTGRIETLESERQDSEKLVAAITDDVTSQVRDALAPSLAALEAKPDRADIDAALAPALEALATKVDKAELEAAINALREELADEIKKLVPKAAADVIREEITALAKELL
ncbi:hypothetical protein [Solidesulfovibrio sp. C21]|uniref:hypothetical protein n=1 Tax=Solidesulfovibrio sp. C21 TaxID=3398613 RepID=UPI0039FB91D5